MSLLRRWFFAGLLVWVPLGVTLLVLRTLIGLLDASLVLVPAALTPSWFDYPGTGAVLTFLLVLATGALTANFLGEKAVALLEGAMQRVPLLGVVYSGIKKVAETVFSGKGHAFQKVVLVEWPHRECWTIGFVTAAPPKEVVQAMAAGQELVTVFVPTTPNPTTGFLLIKPKSEVRDVKMSVQDGMQYVISLGVVAPGASAKAAALAPPASAKPPPSP